MRVWIDCCCFSQELVPQEEMVQEVKLQEAVLIYLLTLLIRLPRCSRHLQVGSLHCLLFIVTVA